MRHQGHYKSCQSLPFFCSTTSPTNELNFIPVCRSAGKEVVFDKETYIVKELTESSFDDVDIALFSAGGAISKIYAPIAAEKGCFVVDNSSAYRMVDSVPLVIPEVNGNIL